VLVNIINKKIIGNAFRMTRGKTEGNKRREERGGERIT